MCCSQLPDEGSIEIPTDSTNTFLIVSCSCLPTDFENKLLLKVSLHKVNCKHLSWCVVSFVSTPLNCNTGEMLNIWHIRQFSGYNAVAGTGIFSKGVLERVRAHHNKDFSPMCSLWVLQSHPTADCVLPSPGCLAASGLACGILCPSSSAQPSAPAGTTLTFPILSKDRWAEHMMDDVVTREINSGKSSKSIKKDKALIPYIALPSE